MRRCPKRRMLRERCASQCSAHPIMLRALLTSKKMMLISSKNSHLVKGEDDIIEEERCRIIDTLSLAVA